ncbi:MAG: ydhC [Ramlibacter sp.]|uniref:Bcr/CflA family efflux MFS transporter n=1 Tax=Ramlibacter sp. TaxID=1917967 RepID=UPI0026302CF3|nr:Bcr/CflA family efflux MFS transporter [Ramlibacter sp.]MDB5752383.1 ydhC [Ramlibacter sp.]
MQEPIKNNESAVPHRHGWLTANLIAQLAFGLVIMTICLPSMQDWPTTFGASQAAVQLTFSGFIAAYGGLQLLYGPLSDRFGRKPILLIGLVVSLLGSLLAMAAPGIGVLTLARVLQGAGSAAGMVVGRAMVQDLFQGRERTRVMAFVGMAMGVCPPLATLVGGNLHVHLGWQANFVLLAALGLGLLAAAWWGLPNLTPAAANRAGGWRQLVSGYGRLVRERAFLLYVVMLAMATATFYTFLGGAPLVLAGYGVTPDRIGWYIMCIPLAYIVGNLLASRLIRLHGDRFILGLGQVGTFAGLLLVLALALAGLHTPLALALPLVLLGIGHGLLAPPTLAGTVGLIPALAGSAAAVGGLMQQLTGALGGFVIGLVPNDSPVNMALLMLGWSVCGLAAQWTLFRFVLRRK